MINNIFETQIQSSKQGWQVTIVNEKNVNKNNTKEGEKDKNEKNNNV